jgi:pantothenate kinase
MQYINMYKKILTWSQTGRNFHVKIKIIHLYVDIKKFDLVTTVYAKSLLLHKRILVHVKAYM